jgi:hypothetical protein
MDRPVHVIATPEHEGEGLMGLSIVGIEASGLSEFADGPVLVAFVGQGPPQVIVRLGLMGAGRSSLLVSSDIPIKARPRQKAVANDTPHGDYGQDTQGDEAPFQPFAVSHDPSSFRIGREECMN